MVLKLSVRDCADLLQTCSELWVAALCQVVMTGSSWPSKLATLWLRSKREEGGLGSSTPMAWASLSREAPLPGGPTTSQEGTERSASFSRGLWGILIYATVCATTFQTIIQTEGDHNAVPLWGQVGVLHILTNWIFAVNLRRELTSFQMRKLRHREAREDFQRQKSCVS